MWRVFMIMTGVMVLAACAARQAPDTDAKLTLPVLSVGMQADFSNYLTHPAPLAFAVAADGGVSSAWVCHNDATCTDKPGVYAQRALESCENQAHGQKCLIYALGRSVQWPGNHTKADLPRHKLVTPRSARNAGPADAKGVIVYLPGYGGGRFPRALDYSLIAGHLQALNPLGWDLLRLNFEFYDYGPKTMELVDDAVRETVKSLRARGYRRILLSGQSRGAWNLLRLARHADVADGFFIDVPAAHGRTHRWNGSVNHNADNALRDFQGLIAQQARNPLLFSFFAKDPFYGGDKAGVVKSLLADRIGQDVFIIDHPTGVTGHGGAGRPAFIQAYGKCMADFAETGRVALHACRQSVDYGVTGNITTVDHAINQGWEFVPEDELSTLLPGLTVFNRGSNDNWAGTYFAASQKTLSWVPGEYVAGNTIGAEWQIADGKLCFVGSRRHHSNNYCYRLMRSDDVTDRLVFISPYDEAYLLKYRHYRSPDEFDFQPGKWRIKPITH